MNLPPEYKKPEQELVCYIKQDLEPSKEHHEQSVGSVMTGNGPIPI